MSIGGSFMSDMRQSSVVCTSHTREEGLDLGFRTFKAGWRLLTLKWPSTFLHENPDNSLWKYLRRALVLHPPNKPGSDSMIFSNISSEAKPLLSLSNSSKQIDEFHIWRYPQFYWALKVAGHTELTWDGHCILIILSYAKSFSFSKQFGNFECSNKFMLSCKEINIPKIMQFWRILQWVLTRMCSISSVIPSAMIYHIKWCAPLVSDIKSFQFSIFWIIQKSGREKCWCSWYHDHMDQRPITNSLIATFSISHPINECVTEGQ